MILRHRLIKFLAGKDPIALNLFLEGGTLRLSTESKGLVADCMFVGLPKLTWFQKLKRLFSRRKSDERPLAILIDYWRREGFNARKND